MYTLGHIGSALLVYAPVAWALSVAGYTRAGAVGLIVAAGVTMIPDIDTQLPIEHRGLTHTIWFAAALSGGFFGLLNLLTSWDVIFIGFVSLTILLSMITHFLADSITPMGITPFAPISNWHHSFDLVYARNLRANLTLFWLGVGAVAIVAMPQLV